MLAGVDLSSFDWDVANGRAEGPDRGGSERSVDSFYSTEPRISRFYRSIHTARQPKRDT